MSGIQSAFEPWFQSDELEGGVLACVHHHLI